MLRFKPGQLVKVRCEIQPGAFADEKLIKIQTEGAVISGFVKAQYLVQSAGSIGFVVGQIVQVTASAVQVRIPASFFTTASGVASVSPNWAQANLQFSAA